MKASPLPIEVLQLFDTVIDSFEKLELLRLVWEAPTGITRADLARELELTPAALRGLIAALTRAELVVRDPDGSLRLGAHAGDAAVETLMRTYDNDQVVVMSALSSVAMSRIRNLASKAFADAFVLRKKRRSDDG